MLEEPDFNAAIAKNLNMLSLPAEIHVAFAIPRRKVNDSTAHSIINYKTTYWHCGDVRLPKSGFGRVAGGGWPVRRGDEVADDVQSII